MGAGAGQQPSPLKEAARAGQQYMNWPHPFVMGLCSST